MSEEEEKFNEMRKFAFFGRSIFLCQSVERILVIYSTTLSVKVNRLTKDRFDELLFENMQKTFGQLLRDFPDSKVFSEQENTDLEKAKNLRDFLTHDYMWERAIEFHKPEHLDKVINEFSGYCIFLEQVYEMICQKAEILVTEYPDINLEEIATEFLKHDSTPTDETFRILKRNETLIDLFGYSNHQDFMIPIFLLEDGTNWTIGEKGLAQWKATIKPENVKKIDKLEGIFPIKQFNPAPKIQSPWNYNLDLKKMGFTVSVRPANPPAHFKWSIVKRPNNTL